jgi:alkylation response protein AidB-like acyl-CoA dehydrogenase
VTSYSDRVTPGGVTAGHHPAVDRDPAVSHDPAVGHDPTTGRIPAGGSPRGTAPDPPSHAPSPGGPPTLALADDDDRAALRAVARRVAAHDLAPLAATWDEEERFAEEALSALRRAELFGLTIDPVHGGQGMGDVEAALVLEELARVDVSSAILCQLVYNGPPRAIEHLGTDVLKDRWLPRAAAGELLCIGITEPDAGSAATSLRSRLVADGDGFRLQGYKNYVTGGHRAVACLVWCRFPDAPSTGGRGIGAVVVDLSAPGVSLVGTHRKMGLRGCTEAELAFDDVRASAHAVLRHRVLVNFEAEADGVTSDSLIDRIVELVVTDPVATR